MNSYKTFFSYFHIGMGDFITLFPALADPPPDPWADRANTYGAVNIQAVASEDVTRKQYGITVSTE